MVVRSDETRRSVEAAGAVPIDLGHAQQAAARGRCDPGRRTPNRQRLPRPRRALGPALSKRQRWIAYASSTAVYGDQKGAWTYESSPLNAASPTGLRRLNAERAWTNTCAAAGLPLVIFRLAGIYGPGRSALDRVREGRARRIEKNNHALSRIHVDDIVTLLEASLQRPESTSRLQRLRRRARLHIRCSHVRGRATGS